MVDEFSIFKICYIRLILMEYFKSLSSSIFAEIADADQTSFLFFEIQMKSQIMSGGIMQKLSLIGCIASVVT